MIAEPVAIDVAALSVAYRKKVVLQDLNLQIRSQIVMGLVGPNGAGKSTLLKSILNLVPKRSGRITILGSDFTRRGSQIAYVPQRTTIDWDFPTTVLDLVLMGTYGRLGWLRRPGRAERSAAAAALERMGIEELADRPIGQLSGGQQQRAFLARAFVQDAPILFLDEPFVGVDMLTEQTIVGLLHELRDAGKTIVVVQHDLTTVGQYLDELALVNKTVVASGAVDSVFTETLIQQTYGGNIKRIRFANES